MILFFIAFFLLLIIIWLTLVSFDPDFSIGEFIGLFISIIVIVIGFSFISVISYNKIKTDKNKVKYFEKGYWEGANAMYEYKNSNSKLLNMKLQKLKEKL